MSPERAAVPAVRIAEQRIQRILVELEEETACKIEHVEIDTRRYAELATEIYVLRREVKPQ